MVVKIDAVEPLEIHHFSDQPVDEGSEIEARFALLMERTAEFDQRHPFPTSNNRLSLLVESGRITKREVVEMADAQHMLVDERIIHLAASFLLFKRERGSDVEQAFYQKISEEDLLQRLIVKRPLAFMTSEDHYRLRDGSEGRGGFEKIGCNDEAAPLLLQDYLSYDELQLSALISLSGPTAFINSGFRANMGCNGPEGSFQERGHQVGMVGARFEKEGLMEWEHMMVTRKQNREANGYGPGFEGARGGYLRAWAEFYEVPHFPTYEEAKSDRTGRFHPLSGGKFLDTRVYKERLRRVLEPFLIESEELAKAEGKRAYIHCVGLGLGEWGKDPEVQGRLMLEVYAELLEKHRFTSISDLDFSYFHHRLARCGGVKSGDQLHGVTIHFSHRSPAAPFTGDDEGKMLVTQFAWDGGSYVGNEYWLGKKYLGSSGDPAAVACSVDGELKNPEVNDSLLKVVKV